MNLKYVDAHCHLQFDDYAEDREEIIECMREQGIAGIVVGCDLDSSRKAVALAEKHSHLFASIGLHPNSHGEEFVIEEYRALAASARVVAFGECGLDYFRSENLDEEEKERQRELFFEHVALAVEFEKPLIIHTRPSKGTQDAYDDMLLLLQEAKEKHPSLRGDMHFFVGNVEQAKAFIALDFTLSFTAVITFAREYDEVLRAIPLASILSETDAPYVAPARRRGARNDPFAVIDVVEKIAEIRNEDAEYVRATLATNTNKLFPLVVADPFAPC